MKKIFLMISICLLLPFKGMADEIEMNLTLNEALDRALHANLSLQVERYDTQAVAFEIDKQWGVFDPNLLLSAKYKENKSPLTKQYSIAAGGLTEIETKDLNLTSALTGKIPWGTEYNMDLSMVRDSSTFNGFNPEYQPVFSTTFVQPLLKDFGTGSNLAFIEISKNRLKSARWKLRQTLVDLLADVEQSYWELFFSVEDLKVKKESLRLSRELLKENRSRAKAGAMPELEVIQTKSGVSVRKQEVLDAKQRVKENENHLKRLLFQEMESARKIHFIPQDLPEPHFEKISPRTRIRTALDHRADLKQLQIDLANENISLKYFRNQKLPRLDLEGTLGWNGLGEGFGNAFEDLTGTDHTVWGGGVTFRYPWGNRLNKSNEKQSRVRVKAYLLRLKAVENDIFEKIDSTSSRVAMLWRKIRMARVSQNYAEEALKAEQKKLKAGVSTSHTVLEFEEELSIAKSNTLRVKVDYMKALAELEKLQGTAVESKGIQFVQDEA
jgi:outer membrane protein